MRSVDATAVYLAQEASLGVEPGAEAREWALMMSNEGLGPRRCPEGMAQLPNKVCMDVNPRFEPVADPSRFNATLAYFRCRAAKARLCEPVDLLYRGECSDPINRCEALGWPPGVPLGSQTYCAPTIAMPSRFDILENEAAGALSSFDHSDIYFSIGLSFAVITNFRGLMAPRSICEDEWREAGQAPYFCCLD